MSKPIYIFSDAHVTGLGAMLGQGDDNGSIKPVAFASRTTNKAERNYLQKDLEAMGLDFGLRRFRKYLVGAPDTMKLITDHKPLLPVFNGIQYIAELGRFQQKNITSEQCCRLSAAAKFREP